MADFDIPPGYELVPQSQPDTSPPSAPQTTPSIPPGYESAPPNILQPPYHGRILPWSTDVHGNSYFDPLSAGPVGAIGSIVGSAIDAYKLSGDILTGQQPTPYTGGPTQDPALLARTTNLASFFSPTSVATRAGEMVPGAIGSRVAPTGAQLKTESDLQYDAARASPVVLPASTVTPHIEAAQQNLTNQFGLTPKTAPKTFDALDDLINPQNPLIDFTTLDATREQLRAIGRTAMSDRDAFASSKAIPHIDNLIDTISPDAATARANLAAAKRANAITGELTQANTGILEKADTAPQLRQRVKTFLQNPDNIAGYSPDEIAQLKAFAEGGDIISSTLSKLGKIPGSGIASSALGIYLGSKFLGEHGAEAGALVAPMAGETLKNWASSRATSQLDAIADMIRSRSPLGQQYRSQNIRTPNPLPWQLAVPGLLSSTPNPNPPLLPTAPSGSMWQPQSGPQRYPPLPTTGPIPAGLLGPWA